MGHVREYGTWSGVSGVLCMAENRNIYVNCYISVFTIYKDGPVATYLSQSALTAYRRPQGTLASMLVRRFDMLAIEIRR